ncbi:MAG TPA: maleylpyruvate isomerase family mycothiol-dependent enzyme [Frankiaceae bacterium]|nr:maleylpyruvate isomerase family mycothiol-dependent enzyme [Frankiaceae bacterium]
MTAMTVERHLAILRHEAGALAEAARRGLDAKVPSCPDWDVRSLVDHVAHAYRWVTRIVSTHADAEVTDDEVPPGTADDPIAAYEEALAELVETIAGEDPDAFCWNWSEQDLRVAFWARRMANETAVHRWDAQLAHGTPQPIDGEIAADGVAEMLEMILPRHLVRLPQEGLRGTFRVEATDIGTVWGGRLHPDHVERVSDPRKADATIKGTASDLVLAFWGREVPIEATGDERITGLLLE